MSAHYFWWHINCPSGGNRSGVPSQWAEDIAYIGAEALHSSAPVSHAKCYQNRKYRARAETGSTGFPSAQLVGQNSALKSAGKTMNSMGKYSQPNSAKPGEKLPHHSFSRRVMRQMLIGWH